MAGWWQQGYDQQWDESWQAPPPPGKGKSKKGQGQGKKGKGKWQQPSEEQEATTTEHTGRIMSKYQFAHALLRAAADDEGSALVKLRKGMDDLAFLAARHLKTLVTNQNHHLLRRPGVGVSEAAASLQAGANMLENMKELNLDAVSAFLLDPDVKQALATLNTRDSTATRNAATIADPVLFRSVFQSFPVLAFSGPFRSSVSVLFCCLVCLLAWLPLSLSSCFCWPSTARVSLAGCRPQAFVACGSCVCVSM